MTGFLAATLAPLLPQGHREENKIKKELII